MANDGGMIALLEQWLADTLKALTSGGKAIFNTADVWRHQIGATAGGMEAFSRFEPFAFVSYQATDAAREGDYDLRQVIEFAILIGVESPKAGDARIGESSAKLGVSKIRDLVIAAFDRQHPAGGLKCDEIYYTGDFEVLDSPKRYMIQMNFETSYLAVE